MQIRGRLDTLNDLRVLADLSINQKCSQSSFRSNTNYAITQRKARGLCIKRVNNNRLYVWMVKTADGCSNEKM